jgi:hypothetical protein
MKLNGIQGQVEITTEEPAYMGMSGLVTVALTKISK